MTLANLKSFLPHTTFESLRTNFPTDHDAAKLFQTSGTCMMWEGNVWSVQLEWKQEHWTSYAQALLIKTHTNDGALFCTLITKGVFSLILNSYVFHSLGSETPTRKKHKESPQTFTLKDDLSIVRFSELLAGGKQTNASPPEIKQATTLAANLFFKEEPNFAHSFFKWMALFLLSFLITKVAWKKLSN